MRRTLFLCGRRKIAVALSGGVDSSVVAYMMKQRQQQQQQELADDLVAVHMSNWNANDEEDPYCTKDKDWKDAQAVARLLELPLHPTSFAAEYWTQVFEPFVSGVEAGLRPNPDVHCNRFIKFGALREYCASVLQAEGLATGHYARLWDRSNSAEMPLVVQEALDSSSSEEWLRTWGSTNNHTELTPLLMAAHDRSKCQSFFLSSVPGTAFRNVYFPLGDLIKNNPQTTKTTAQKLQNKDTTGMSVRELALAASLPTAKKKDSMGICFVGKRPGGFTHFIDQYFADETNADNRPTGTEQQQRQQQQHSYDFIDIDTGEVVPNHAWQQHSFSHHMVYTRGQRAKISGASHPWFVVRTYPHQRAVLVCQGTHHPALYCDTFFVQAMHWIAGDLPTPMTTDTVLHAKCRIRNLQPLVDCVVTHDAANGRFIIQTAKPLRAITPGQHCAIYGLHGLVCLGGGAVVEHGPSYLELGKELQPHEWHPAGHNDLSKPSISEETTLPPSAYG